MLQKDFVKDCFGHLGINFTFDARSNKTRIEQYQKQFRDAYSDNIKKMIDTWNEDTSNEHHINQVTRFLEIIFKYYTDYKIYITEGEHDLFHLTMLYEYINRYHRLIPGGNGERSIDIVNEDWSSENEKEHRTMLLERVKGGVVRADVIGASDPIRDDNEDGEYNPPSHMLWFQSKQLTGLPDLQLWAGLGRSRRKRRISLRPRKRKRSKRQKKKKKISRKHKKQRKKKNKRKKSKRIR